MISSSLIIIFLWGFFKKISHFVETKKIRLSEPDFYNLFRFSYLVEAESIIAEESTTDVSQAVLSHIVLSQVIVLSVLVTSVSDVELSPQDVKAKDAAIKARVKNCFLIF